MIATRAVLSSAVLVRLSAVLVAQALALNGSGTYLGADCGTVK